MKEYEVPKKWLWGKKNIWQLGESRTAKNGKFIIEYKTRHAYHKPRLVRGGSTTLQQAKAFAFLDASSPFVVKGSVRVYKNMKKVV